MKKRKGVTLIEIMVVMGIAAFLLAVLLPMLSRARDRAVLVACQSNLRQIGQALHMYMSMNKSKLPPEANIPWPDQTSLPDPETHLPTILAEYAGKGLGVYECPGDEMVAKTVGGSYLFLAPPTGPGGTYYYGNIFNRSSHTALVMEMPLSAIAYINKAGHTDLLTVPMFHRRGKLNTLYADGHVESEN